MTTARPLGRRRTLFAVLATGAMLFGLVIAARAGAGTSSPRLTSHASVRSVSPDTAPSHGTGSALYDQYDNPGSFSSSSQNFEASNNSYDDELADDFVIPGGIGWNIQTVDVSGEYFNGPGPASSVNVKFYSNGGSNRPGSLLAGAPEPGFTNGPSFSIPLAPRSRSARARTGSRCRRTRTSFRRGSGAGGTGRCSRTWTPPGRTRATASGPDARRGVPGRPASVVSTPARRIRSSGCAATRSATAAAASAAASPAASALRDHDADRAVDRTRVD